jgi:ubiquinone/menaquinone biosynthesis C-methylase UbiE
MTAPSNFDLKEEIRAYWGERSKTYDLSAGHRIADGAEAAAWAGEFRRRLGDAPLRVLELGCGTGEITGVLHGLGHAVTALDFSDAMLARAQAKHAGKPRLRFVLADAGNTMEPDGSHDAIVCRNLVWTLTEPASAFGEWHRVLRPGGVLLLFDGDWAKPSPIGHLAQAAIRLLDRWLGDDAAHHDGMAERHQAIMRELPFGDGLSADQLWPMLTAAGFGSPAVGSQARIAAAQRHGASARDRLRSRVYRRFVIACRSARPD